MLSKIKIYSDGGARGNPGPAAIGFLIEDEHGRRIQAHGETIGANTNNVAEYTAVIKALEAAHRLGAQEIDYYVDSQLVAFQLSGQYKVKTPHILVLFKRAKECAANFKKVTFTHVPREHEKLREADKLVNQALDEAIF